MARVKRAVHGRKSHRAVLEQAEGYYGNRSRTFRAANEAVMHSLHYAYRDRRARKGDFRRLWIQRINAAARRNGTSYSRLIAGLRVAEIEVDRKVLADLAVREPAAFAGIVALATSALESSKRPGSDGQVHDGQVDGGQVHDGQVDGGQVDDGQVDDGQVDGAETSASSGQPAVGESLS